MLRTKFPRCPHCRRKDLPEGYRIHPECVGPWWAKQREKKAKAMEKKLAEAKRNERKRDKERREALKKIPDLLREAQRQFNKWVRARDHDQPCISCGAPPPDLSGFHAGRDAGHYRSVGSASHLRFHEDNCHAQCVHCNQFGAGRAVDYRIGLVARIGLSRVEALEASNEPNKWTREGVIAIRDTYKQKLKELKSATHPGHDGWN